MKRIIDLRFAVLLLLFGNIGSTLVGYMIDGTQWFALDALIAVVTIVSFVLVFLFAGKPLEDKEQ